MNDFASKNAGGVTFSELHALTIADIDGDGIQDIITGKRHWAHLESYTDPDPHGAPVLYWYRTVRNPKAPGGAEFVPELIHNRSGVGSMIQVGGSEQGRRDRYHGGERPRRAHLLEHAEGRRTPYRAAIITPRAHSRPPRRRREDVTECGHEPLRHHVYSCAR